MTTVDGEHDHAPRPFSKPHLAGADGGEGVGAPLGVVDGSERGPSTRPLLVTSRSAARRVTAGPPAPG